MTLHNSKTKQLTPVTALIDSGAQENFVSKEFAELNHLEPHNLKQPITLRFSNGSTTKDSKVLHYAIMNITIDG